MTSTRHPDVPASVRLRARTRTRTGWGGTEGRRGASWIRRGAAAGLVTAVSLLGAVVGVPAAQASTASSFAGLINGARASAGLSGYQYSGDLAAVAQGQADRMAAAKRLYHNPNLTTDVKNWQWVGENVGYGPDVNTLFSAFMHSPPHRANILDHDFTQVGVGAVTAGGTIWVSMVFRKPLGGSSTTAPLPSGHPRTTQTHAPATVHRQSTGRTTTAPTHAVVRPAARTLLALRVLPRGVSCSASPRVASLIRYLADQERTARLVAQSQRLVLGFQCGARLAPTGVLDPPTLRALAH